MNLFGKKSEDEEIDDEEFNQEELEDRKLTRKFRDLKPENKKKRKEPPKPWGKKERIIVLSFFLVTTIVSASMFLFSHDLKFPGLPKISFTKINFKNPFAEQVIHLGQKSDFSESDNKAKNIVSFFEKEIQPLSGFYGFFVVRNDGTSYGVSKQSKFQGASVLKLPLMVLVYKMYEEGNIDLDSKYILQEEDKVAGSGKMALETPGKEYTYRALVELMGKNSDRTAYKVMKDIVGEDNLKRFISDIGMIDTDIKTGITTPSDVANLLQKLLKGEVLTNENRDEILRYLTDTDYEDWIVKGIPKNIKVPHKFGQDAGVVADTAIVLTDQPYILVIMSQGTTSSEADIFFPKFSEYIYKTENDVK